MLITEIEPAAFYDLAYRETAAFLGRIADNEIFAVKSLFDPVFIRNLRDDMFAWGQRSEASWHPLKDGCPDYHRLHDNYPDAYVKQKFHAFYRHGYNADNAKLFDAFEAVFALKKHLSSALLTPEKRQAEPRLERENKPSDFVVSRINIHHYPKGGGYQAILCRSQ